MPELSETKRSLAIEDGTSLPSESTMIDNITDRLELTEEEAYALLSLCIMSAGKMDADSERAFKKLAEFCKKHKSFKSNHTGSVGCELITEAS